MKEFNFRPRILFIFIYLLNYLLFYVYNNESNIFYNIVYILYIYTIGSETATSEASSPSLTGWPKAGSRPGQAIVQIPETAAASFFYIMQKNII